MKSCLEQILSTVEPKSRVLELAKRRITEETPGNVRFGGNDPYEQIVSAHLSFGGDRVSADKVCLLPNRDLRYHFAVVPNPR